MMPPTTGYDFGDIVLVPFPFTDQSAAKKRPAIVISSDAYHRSHRDLIIMAVTSVIRVAPSFGEMAIQDWRAAGLLMPSVVKPVVAAIERSLVLRSLGRLTPADQHAVRGMLSQIVG